MKRVLFALTAACLLAATPAAAGIWITQEELDALPDSGAAWSHLLNASASNVDPDLGDQDDKSDTTTLAKALVCAKLGGSRCEQTRAALEALVEHNAINNSRSWDWLGTCRSIGSYAIAADIIDLASFDPSFDQNEFRPWLAAARTAITEGGRGSVVSSQENRPNNYGTHASASRIAASLYLQDTDDLQRAIQVFRGWLGDRSSYAGFSYGSLAWQADQSRPVGINPAGSTIEGHPVSGVLPDDQRRSGSFTWPPPKENYAYEGLQGATTAAELLHRAGYAAFEWEDRAICRAHAWLNEVANYPAEGDDRWQTWIVNKRCGTDYATTDTPSPGKMIGWTSWTHSLAGDVEPPDPPVCGNGVREGAEQCDGGIGSASCTSLGFDAGILTCGLGCQYDTSGCTTAPPMGCVAPCIDPADCPAGACDSCCLEPPACVLPVCPEGQELQCVGPPVWNSE